MCLLCQRASIRVGVDGDEVLYCHRENRGKPWADCCRKFMALPAFLSQLAVDPEFPVMYAQHAARLPELEFDPRKGLVMVEHYRRIGAL